MRWRFGHGKRGTCVPRCRSYGYCHCGCGEKTSLAKAKSQRWEQVRGEPYIFKAHHYKQSQWGPPRMADCHPEKPHHSRGLCSACHWKREKRSRQSQNRPFMLAWEHQRYTRFQELIGDGLDFGHALRQLEKDVPSEMLEEAQ